MRVESKGVKQTGAPCLEELRKTPGFPDEEQMKKGPIAFIECVEEIPCNPCETSCPYGAIVVGNPITNLPVLNAKKCKGCGLCVAACPGLAIYIKDYTYEENRALITFPFEYLPLPEKGQKVTMVDRMGQEVCSGEVIRVMKLKGSDRTPLVSVAYDKQYFIDVVSMKRIKQT